MAGEYVLGDGGSVSVSREAVEKLLGASSGDAALLYLYILSCGGRLDAADAAAAIHRSPSQVEGAVEVLSRLGLVSLGDRAARPPRLERAEELPDYTPEEIAREARNGSLFSELVANVQQSLGSTLSSEGLKTLFGIYDYLRLDPDVILMLVNWCVAEYQRRYGQGRRPSMRYIEKTAYAWEREGVLSMDAAIDFIKRQERLRAGERDYMEAMGLMGRTLSASEKRYIDSWLDMGLDAGAAAVAYDRTVLKTGRLTWRYMDSIMRSWHSKGIRTVRDIEEKDAPPDRKKPPAAGNAGKNGTTANEYRQMRETLRMLKGEDGK